MPKFTLSCTSSLPPAETFEKLETQLPIDPDLNKLGGDLEFYFDKNTLTGSAKGSKFKALMEVKPVQMGSQVALHVDLPFTLTPFKGIIQSTLEKKFKNLIS
jgi:hypothetical protein